jgi:hypothetical protein
MISRAAGGHDHHDLPPLKKDIPADSWPRPSDYEDPYYFYNKYGPFHLYTVVNTIRMGDPHNIPEDDPYRMTP